MSISFSASKFRVVVLSRSHISPFADALIVVPGLSTRQVTTFFRYLFSDRFVQDFDCADVAALDAVRAELKIDGLDVAGIRSDAARDLLQEAVLASLGDDPRQEEAADDPHPPRSSPRNKETRKHLHKLNGRCSKPSAAKDNKSKKKKEKRRKTCLFCDKSYGVTRNRNLHMISHHLGECQARGMLLPCGRCDEIFVSRKGRKMHMETAHGILRVPKKVR